MAASPTRPSPLPAALDAERRVLGGRAGNLGCYVAGQGRPMLLVHSINAAGSAYEVKPIFEHAIRSRRVHALDLPGFGSSDRSDRYYEPGLYVAAIHDVLDAIEAESGPMPVDVLAISLSSEFVARAAIQRPASVRTLAMVTPTGFSRSYAAPSSTSPATREVPGLYKFFTFPLWSEAIYDLLVSRRSIRYFLERTFGSKAIDEGMLEYDYLTAHQPGAKNAPYAFVSGRLFSRDIPSVYQQLEMPVWVPHATRGDFKDFSAAGWTKARPNWLLQPYDAGALPHFEQPDRFRADYDRFLQVATADQLSSGPSEPRSPSP